MRYFNNPEAFMKLMASMQSGIVATLTIFFATLVFSIPLGMVIALLRMNRRRIISVPVSLYILVMRGTFFHGVLPQVGKRVLLPVSNEVITLVKDTSLANIIAVGELFRAAKNEASRTASVEPLFVAGLFYLLMNGVVTLVFSYLTRRMDYYKD